MFCMEQCWMETITTDMSFCVSATQQWQSWQILSASVASSLTVWGDGTPSDFGPRALSRVGWIYTMFDNFRFGASLLSIQMNTRVNRDVRAKAKPFSLLWWCSLVQPHASWLPPFGSRLGAFKSARAKIFMNSYFRTSPSQSKSTKPVHVKTLGIIIYMIPR